MKHLSADQKGVLRGGAVALGIALMIGVPPYVWLPPRLVGAPLGGEVADHLAYAFKWTIPIHLWLAVCIRQVSRGRFNTPADITLGLRGAEPSYRRAACDLAELASANRPGAGACLALAATLRGRELVLIPILVGFFLAGRALSGR